MYVIKQADTLLHKESAEIIQDYKLSAFCITQEVDAGVLLCHAATGELVLLNTPEYQTVCSGSPLVDDWASYLAAHRFLCDPTENEYAEVDRQRETVQIKAAQQDCITSFTILPTSRCNAQCFYCYEKGIAQKNMSRKTAEDVVDFIIRSSKGQQVHIGWFGGEPTIAHPIISLICQRLREKKINFRSSMISNGLLLDEALIQTAAANWNLRQVQITIDGTESVYNTTKNYKGKQSNPFLTVLSHIDSLLESKIRVSVRINLGVHNYEDSSLLIGQLAQRFHGKKGIKVYVHEIDNYYSNEQYMELMARTNELNQELIRQGLQDTPSLPSIRLHSCMADSDDSVVINPDGQLGKCEHFVFDKLHGSIYHADKDNQLIQAWKEPVVFAQCRTCPFYAACLRLKWCNGGSYFCKDGIIQNKILQTQNTMLRIYNSWKAKRRVFRESNIFWVPQQFETREVDGQLSAVFFPKNANDLEKTIPVNQTSLDILEFLQEKHTFRDIVDMLNQKYDTSLFAVEDIVEEYLQSIVQEKLCTLS